MPDRTPALAGLLVGVASVELAFLRIGTRTAVHIPGLDRLSAPFRVISETGRLAYYLAVVLLVVLLGILAVRAGRSGRHLAAGSVVAFLAAAVLARAGALPDRLLGVVLVGTILLLATPLRRRLPEGTFGPLFVLAFLTAAGSQLTGSSAAAPALISESSAVAAGLAAPLAVRGSPIRRARLAGALAVASLLTIALLLAPWTTKILLLWNFGMAGLLPAVAYGLAAGCLVYTVVTAAREGHSGLAWGLGLLALGGVGLLSTYQSGLTVAGLVLVAEAILVPDEKCLGSPSLLPVGGVLR